MNQQELEILSKIHSIIVQSRQTRDQIKYRRKCIKSLQIRIFELAENKHKVFWYKRYKIQQQIDNWSRQIIILMNKLERQHETRYEYLQSLEKLNNGYQELQFE